MHLNNTDAQNRLYFFCYLKDYFTFMSSYPRCISMIELSLLKAKGINQQFIKFQKCSRASGNSDHGKSSTDTLIDTNLHHTFTVGVFFSLRISKWIRKSALIIGGHWKILANLFICHQSCILNDAFLKFFFACFIYLQENAFPSKQ